MNLELLKKFFEIYFNWKITIARLVLWLATEIIFVLHSLALEELIIQVCGIVIGFIVTELLTRLIVKKML